MKIVFLVVIAIGMIGFMEITFAVHDPDQPRPHSIILPPDAKEKTSDEFMEWCNLYYGEKKCTELYKKNLTNDLLSPLKQFKSGLAIDKIQCKESLVLMSKHDGSPACVTQSTAPQLANRGWSWVFEIMNWDKIDEYSVALSVFKVTKDNTVFDVEYSITKGTVKDIVYSNDAKSLLVTIDSTGDGDDEERLTLSMPRDLIDSKMDYCPPRKANPPDDVFFVLIGGVEVFHDEVLTTSEKRVLQIPFHGNASSIEIIGACYV